MFKLHSVDNTILKSVYNFLNADNFQIEIGEINKQDNFLIQKRGFIIKNIFSQIDLLNSFFICNAEIFFRFILSIGFIGIIILFDIIFPENDLINYIVKVMIIFILIGVILIPYIHLLKNIIFYIFFGKVFYTQGGIIINDKKYKHLDEMYLFKGMNIFYIKFNNAWGMYRLKYFIVLIINLFFIFTFGIIIGINFYLVIILGLGFIFLLKFFVQSLHPLYAFGNIGEKIQKLTPRIEEKSREIQSNFQSDMNYRTLSEGFNSLSSAFSDIVSLVIKLEQIEKRANKGNLFDSEKYIDSLRGDIVEPLNSLKSFLEGQREKLRDSQQELQKVQVRVGSSDEVIRESELSSKRGDSLMMELDENIGKLDEMIGKIS